MNTRYNRHRKSINRLRPLKIDNVMDSFSTSKNRVDQSNIGPEAYGHELTVWPRNGDLSEHARLVGRDRHSTRCMVTRALQQGSRGTARAAVGGVPKS